MCDSTRSAEPSCTADALLMLQRALGYLAACDPVSKGAASKVRAASLAREFASGGALDQAPPEPTLVGIADEATGPDGRCAGASDDAVIGVLAFWQRLEARAAERKLAVVAELIRRRPAPGCSPQGPAAMPRAWGEFCGDELAAETATSGVGAEKTLTLAYDLAARLPGTARALHDGVIDAYKARIISDATRVLDDSGAAAAEALVLPDIAGKTPGQIRAAIARAVLTIDPDAARLRREMAQKDARVELWREDAGTAALCGYGLPPDEALAADQQISARARELRASGLDGTMDQLRVRAYFDFLLGQDSRLRTDVAEHEPNPPGQDTDDDGAQSGGPDRHGHAGDDGMHPPGPGYGHGPAPGPGHGSGPGGTSTGMERPDAPPEADQGASPPGRGETARPQASASARTGLAARINLTIPLATLLGLADRPGEAHGLGPIDPALARTLAVSAAGNPRTTWCVTVTDQDGHPTAHGCARPARNTSSTQGGGGTGNRDGPAFTPDHGSGHGHSPAGPDGHGRWRLHTPGPAGRDYTIDIGPLAVTDCDHRDESAGYEPSDRLRHLVEIRDGECTWPPCRRQARNCDFEHAVPYDQGGRTCACNAGARCRHHHHAKQAPGWRLDQHQPGYHTWTTPAGRTYTSGPTSYPI